MITDVRYTILPKRWFLKRQINIIDHIIDHINIGQYRNLYFINIYINISKISNPSPDRY
jgi:hypothetical protein